MNIGIVGLDGMGRTLALNFGRDAYAVAGYDVHPRFSKSLLEPRRIKIFDSLNGLAAVQDKPRIILMMAPAGKPVD